MYLIRYYATTLTDAVALIIGTTALFVACGALMVYDKACVSTNISCCVARFIWGRITGARGSEKARREMTKHA